LYLFNTKECIFSVIVCLFRYFHHQNPLRGLFDVVYPYNRSAAFYPTYLFLIGLLRRGHVLRGEIERASAHFCFDEGI
jgi:hypothetical protein